MIPSSILVEFALLAGSTVNPLFFTLDSASRGVLGTNTLAPNNTLTNYADDRIMTMNVTRTSDRVAGPVVTYNAGTATVRLLNVDAALDPYVLEQAGLTAPGVVMRIRKTYAGVTYPVFYGYVDDWAPSRDGPELATVTVTATDPLGWLQGKTFTPLAVPVGGSETTGARINRVLTMAGWPNTAADRFIATGNATMQASVLEGTGLDLANEAALNEVGEFYADASGRMVFRNRQATYSDARSANSQGTFGSNIAGGEVPYIGDPGGSWNKSQLLNTMKVTRDGGTEQVYADAFSVGRYGEYSKAQDLRLETDAAALDWAAYVVQSDKAPEFRFTNIRINTAVMPSVTWPHALTRELGDRITVVRRPVAKPFGSIVDSRQLFIRGITHDWSASSKQWITTWDLSPTSKLPFFILGSGTQGVLGTNALAF